MNTQRKTDTLSAWTFAAAVLILLCVCGCTTIDKPGALFNGVRSPDKKSSMKHDESCRCRYCRYDGWGRIYAGSSHPGLCATRNQIGLSGGR